MATRIRFQLRRGVSTEWTSVNPVLLQGEPGVETDTGKLKIGNGTGAWATLPYATGGDISGGEGYLAGLVEDPADPGTFTYETLDGLGATTLDELTDVDLATITPVEGDLLGLRNGKWAPFNPPEPPVTSVNGQIGDVNLDLGFTNLEALDDVTTLGATDGQALVFTGGEWRPGTVVTTDTGATILDELADVSVASPTPLDGQVLTYDGTTGLWIAGTGAATAGAMTYRGEWVEGTTYAAGDVVSYNGQLWVAQTAGTDTPAAGSGGGGTGAGTVFYTYDFPYGTAPAEQGWTFHTGDDSDPSGWFYGEGTSYYKDETGPWTGKANTANALIIYPSPTSTPHTARLSVTFDTDGVFSFWDAYSAPARPEDYVSFTVNGTEVHRTASDANAVAFNDLGYQLQPWTRRTYNVAAGTPYVFEWAYHAGSPEIGSGPYNMYWLAGIQATVDGVEDPQPNPYATAWSDDFTSWDTRAANWHVLQEISYAEGRAQGFLAGWPSRLMVSYEATATQPGSARDGTGVWTDVRVSSLPEKLDPHLIINENRATEELYHYRPINGELLRYNLDTGYTTLGTVAGATLTGGATVTITVDNGAFTIEQVDGAGTHTGTFTDPNPVTGGGWGINIGYDSSDTTGAYASYDSFSWTPLGSTPVDTGGSAATMAVPSSYTFPSGPGVDGNGWEFVAATLIEAGSHWFYTEPVEDSASETGAVPVGQTWTSAMALYPTESPATYPDPHVIRWTVRFDAPGTLSFWDAYSAPARPDDYVAFRANGQEVFRTGSTANTTSGSGVTYHRQTYTQHSYPVNAGTTYVFEWSYTTTAPRVSSGPWNMYWLTGIKVTSTTGATYYPATEESPRTALRAAATTGQWLPLGGGAEPAPATLDGLTDVNTTDYTPTDGQVLTWDTEIGLWRPATTAAASGTGSMMWRGDYNNATTYHYGDVVRSTDGLFVALDTVVGSAPALPMDAVVDTFERALLGPTWNVNTGGSWSIVSGELVHDGSAGWDNLINTNLTPDGQVSLSNIKYEGNTQLGVIFAYVDSLNYYRAWVGEYGGGSYTITKVVNGAVTKLAELTGSADMPASSMPSMVVTKTGGQITLQYTDYQGQNITVEVVDPTPLNGSGWGLCAHGWGGYKNKVGAFKFDPAQSGKWSVIERRWALDSLTDVQTEAPLDGQTIAYDADTHTWLPTDLPSPATTLDSLTDVDTTGASSGQALAFDGTAWHPVPVQGWSGTVSVAALGYADLYATAAYSASTSGYAFKGETYTPDVSISLTAVTAQMNVAAGTTYKAMVVTLTGSTIGQVIASSAPYTPTAAATNTRVRFPVDLLVPAGTQYTYLVGATSTAGTFGLPVGANSTVPRTTNNPYVRYTGTASVRVASAAPAAGTPVDTTSGNTSAGFLVGVEFTTGAKITAGIDTLADVDTTTTAPATGQALVYDGAQWVPGTVAGGEGGTGGSARPGTMVWGDNWSSTTAYVHGDVVRHAQALWVAKEANTSVTPALPGLGFSDDFNRADGTIGQFWDYAELPWGVKDGKARIDGGSSVGSKHFYRTGLGTDGVGTWLKPTVHNGIQASRLTFGITDKDNCYGLDIGNGTLYRVVNGTSTEIGRARSTTGTAFTQSYYNVVTVTRSGGTITVVMDTGSASTTVSLTVVDPTPLQGTGWGVRHTPYSDSFTWTEVDSFSFAASTASPWTVLERRWNTTSLDDVFAPTILPGQVLAWNALASRWEPTTIAAGSVASVVHGADPTAPRPAGAVAVHWYGSVAPLNAQPRDEWIEESA